MRGKLLVATSRWATKRSHLRIILWLTIASVVLIATFVGSAIATNASSFCKSCREMGP